jgi:small conductance mechanosensitive channel
MSQELEGIQKFYNIMIEFFANYALQIVGAFILLLIGVVVSKYVYTFVLQLLLKKNLDETLSNFIARFIRILIIVMMGVLALGKLGISIAPFVAALGAISLTAGLALQGSVSNFAAGIVLIVTKPFKIGDTILVHERYGQVKEIRLAYTLLENEDKEEITIPNKYMIGDVLVNSFEYRIVEGSVGIAYESDVAKAIQEILHAIKSFDVISKEEPIVGLQSFGDSALEIGYRYWAPTKSYYKTMYSVNQKIHHAMKESGITIAFPQREVRLIQSKETACL